MKKLLIAGLLSCGLAQAADFTMPVTFMTNGQSAQVFLGKIVGNAVTPVVIRAQAGNKLMVNLSNSNLSLSLQGPNITQPTNPQGYTFSTSGTYVLVLQQSGMSKAQPYEMLVQLLAQ